MLNTIASAGIAFLMTTILSPLLIKFLYRFNLTDPSARNFPPITRLKHLECPSK